MFLKDNPAMMAEVEEKVKVILGVSAKPDTSEGEVDEG